MQGENQIFKIFRVNSGGLQIVQESQGVVIPSTQPLLKDFQKVINTKAPSVEGRTQESQGSFTTHGGLEQRGLWGKTHF